MLRKLRLGKKKRFSYKKERLVNLKSTFQIRRL